MKNFHQKFLVPFLGFLLMVSVIYSGIHDLAKINISPVVFVVGMVVLAIASAKFSPKIPNVNMNNVENEVWANYIIQRFYKDNKFLQYAFSDDDKVLAGKIVHIPQPGALPTVMKNRDTFPITSVRRVDSDIIYALDVYSTGTTHITDAEKVELTYDKINDVYGDHAGVLSQDASGDLLIKWLLGLPQNFIIRTLGDDTTDILEGATGTRKKCTHDSLRKAQKLMNRRSVDKNDRLALISSNMYEELLESLSNTQYRDFSQYVDASKGVLGRLYDFDIMDRADVAVASDDGSGNISFKPYGAAVEATDLDVAMCWQKNSVARALGEVKFFGETDRADYQGDIYSALLRMGGRRRRADNLGVIAIVQGV